MSLPTIIENQLNSFLKPTLTFNPTYQQYTFNDMWLNDISDEYFKKEVLTIVKMTNEHLIVGTKIKEFLNYLITITDKRLDWYRYYEFPEIDTFHRIVSQINSIDYAEYLPSDDKYLFKDIIEKNIDLTNENGYYFDLIQYSEIFSNYSNAIDIENVKLHYVLELHYNYIQDVASYLDSLSEDCERVDFARFNFEMLPLMKRLVAPTFLNDVPKKCKTNLNKVEIAHLFYLLVDEKMLVFDANERQNDILMKKFIEQNFSYKDDDGFQKNIINVNKEFSKIGYSNTLSHNKFIDSLILKLEDRKSHIR